MLRIMITIYLPIGGRLLWRVRHVEECLIWWGCSEIREGSRGGLLQGGSHGGAFSLCYDRWAAGQV